MNDFHKTLPSKLPDRLPAEMNIRYSARTANGEVIIAETKPGHFVNLAARPVADGGTELRPMTPIVTIDLIAAVSVALLGGSPGRIATWPHAARVAAMGAILFRMPPEPEEIELTPEPPAPAGDAAAEPEAEPVTTVVG